MQKMKNACMSGQILSTHVLDFFMHLHVLNFPCTHLTRAGGHRRGERQGSQVRASGSVRPVREFMDFSSFYRLEISGLVGYNHLT
jgi:hypothetical protein